MLQGGTAATRKRKRPAARKDTESEDEFGFAPHRSKKSRTQTSEEPFRPQKQDNIEWTPMGAPKADRISKKLIEYEEQNCQEAPNGFCFACRRVGENMPYFSTSKVQDVLISIYNGFRTTSEDEHYIQSYEMFETLIRRPINAKLSARKSRDQDFDEFNLIPEWRPSMIKEHVESHHTDPELTMELLARNTLSITKDIYNHCLFKKGIIYKPKPLPTVNLPEGEDTRDVFVPQEEERENQEDVQPEPVEPEYDETEVIDIDPEKWKIYKEATELSIKILRSDPRKMLPFYIKDRFVVEQRAGHPFFDLETKKLVTPTTGKRCAL